MSARPHQPKNNQNAMGYLPDISIRDSDHNQIAVVEVKGFQTLDEHAIEIHELFSESVARPIADFFLLITPEKGFLWTEGSIREDGKANHVFEMSEVLDQYRGDKKSIDPIRKKRLEFLVFRWLFDVTWQNRSINTMADKALEDSGFNEATVDAHISFGLAA